MRAAGRLVGVRHVAFKRVGDEKDGLDLFTDTGDGTRPLGVRFDLDDRGPEAPDDAKATFVDTQLRNLAARTQVRFEPAGATSPSRIAYEASSTMRVDTEARLAEAEGSACGEGKVTCLTAAINALPPSLTLELPAKDGTDYRVDHTGSTKPTLTATIDRTDVKETEGQPDELDRTWAKIALAQLPQHMAGRLDQKEGVLKAAEFHACNYDFSVPKCTDAQDAIGQVEFTVRDRPDRGDLPPRPETARQAVTLLKRCTQRVEPLPCAEEQMEVHGLITDVRNVAFHQRDLDEDGKADGTLGVLVERRRRNLGVRHARRPRGRSARRRRQARRPRQLASQRRRAPAALPLRRLRAQPGRRRPGRPAGGPAVGEMRPHERPAPRRRRYRQRRRWRCAQVDTAVDPLRRPRRRGQARWREGQRDRHRHEG